MKNAELQEMLTQTHYEKLCKVCMVLYYINDANLYKIGTELIISSQYLVTFMHVVSQQLNTQIRAF